MTTRKADPYGAHRFRVTCDVLPKLGFTEVRGLRVRLAEPAGADDAGTDDGRPEPRLEIPSVPELRRFPRLPGGGWRRPTPPSRETTSPHLTLRRGVTDDQALWNWFQRWVDGRVKPQDVRVCLLDAAGEPARGWVCRAARPVEWRGPDLVATEAQVAMETLTLAHEGIEPIVDLGECSEERY